MVLNRIYEELYKIGLKLRLYERAHGFYSFCTPNRKLIGSLLEKVIGPEIKIEGVEIKVKGSIRPFAILDTKYRTSRYEIQEGDVVVDAGAFPGIFTIYAAKKVGPEGKVIAFEPEENNFEVLKKNIELNGLDNVITVKKGLWNENCKLSIVSKGILSNFGTRDETNRTSGRVDAVKLGSELKRLDVDQIDFIKMDIEGAEIEALQGMRQVLKKHQPHLAIASYHIRNGSMTYPKVEEILKRTGYNPETPRTKFGREKITFASSPSFSSE